MPRSSARCAIGRPLSSANRTPRSSSSSGYFLGLDMTAENLSPGQHPRIDVPAKPGPAHAEGSYERGRISEGLFAGSSLGRAGSSLAFRLLLAAGYGGFW